MLKTYKVTAAHNMGKTVRITLPAVTVDTHVDHARELRDALNAILPETIEDLMHDPRIRDLDILRAAQAILAERHQDTENLAYTIDAIKRNRESSLRRSALLFGEHRQGPEDD